MKKLKNVPVTTRGQWEYPGQPTIVPTPSGQITMKGVPYPVLGTDETGFAQMMMPGGEYTFPGEMVYEQPVKGWMDKYQGGGENLPNFERIQDVNIKVKRKKKSDNPNYFWKNGDLFYKPVSPDAPDLPATKVNRLNPTLEDLVSTVGADAPIDATYKNPDDKVVLPPSKYMNTVIDEYVKPEVLNKTFGQIEENQGHFLDEGYSKRRAWVNTPYFPTEDTMNNLANDNLHSYFLVPKKPIPGYDIDYSKGETMELTNQQYDTVGHSPVLDEPNAEQYNLNNNWFSPANSWNRSRQLAVEMQNNPEIVAWAREHNVDLSSKPRASEKGKELQTGEFFAPRVAEQMLAKKGADQGDAIVTAPLRNYARTRVIQDPSAFDLVGYADNNTVRAFMEKYKKDKGVSSITPEMEGDFKKAMFKELNIDADPNKVYTHFNRSPLTEYTPGMQMGGENLPVLKTKMDVSNFYLSPLSQKYGITQSGDGSYQYYLKSTDFAANIEPVLEPVYTPAKYTPPVYPLYDEPEIDKPKVNIEYPITFDSIEDADPYSLVPITVPEETIIVKPVEKSEPEKNKLKGTVAVQNYQRMLNKKLNTVIEEDGVWVKETQEA